MKKREAPYQVTVGSGITEYNRRPSIYDDTGVLENARTGAFTVGSLRYTTAPFWPEIRSQTVDLCRAIYAKAGKADPFAWSDPSGKHRPVELSEIESRGRQYSYQLIELGLQLNALLEATPEDHTPIWFASRMAILLNSIEMQIAGFPPVTPDEQGTMHPVNPDEAARVLAQRGWELGRLHTQYDMKSQHEDDALGGKRSKRGRENSLAARKRKAVAARREAFEIMRAEIDRGVSARAAADLAVSTLTPRLGVAEYAKATDRLVKAYARAHRHK